jgi:hypothetical protein
MKCSGLEWLLFCGFVSMLGAACGVRIIDEDGSYADDGTEDDGEDDDGSASGGTGDDDGGPGVGTPCKYLTGTATLLSYGGDSPGDYNEALYSFELATKDIDLHYNDGDLLYMVNMFTVNTVVDDRSFIVDIGDVALDNVPATVDPDDYPLGNWDEHDDVQAVLNHTYIIRTIDGNTDQWAALRVNALSPGHSVTFEWIRSPNPDRLDIPVQCL